MKENVIHNNSITWKYTDLLSNSVALSAAQSEEFICVSHEWGSTYVCASSRVVWVTAKSKTTAATISNCTFYGSMWLTTLGFKVMFSFLGREKKWNEEGTNWEPSHTTYVLKLSHWKGFSNQYMYMWIDYQWKISVLIVSKHFSMRLLILQCSYVLGSIFIMLLPTDIICWGKCFAHYKQYPVYFISNI